MPLDVWTWAILLVAVEKEVWVTRCLIQISAGIKPLFSLVTPYVVRGDVGAIELRNAARATGWLITWQLRLSCGWVEVTGSLPANLTRGCPTRVPGSALALLGKKDFLFTVVSAFEAFTLSYPLLSPTNTPSTLGIFLSKTEGAKIKPSACLAIAVHFNISKPNYLGSSRNEIKRKIKN